MLAAGCGVGSKDLAGAGIGGPRIRWRLRNDVAAIYLALYALVLTHSHK